MNARWDSTNPDNDMKFQHNHRYAEILFPEPRKTLSLGETTTDVVLRKEEELGSKREDWKWEGWANASLKMEAPQSASKKWEAILLTLTKLLVARI